MNKEELYNFLKSNGFVLIKQSTSEYFGDYLDLFECETFGLSFVSSKSDESVDIYNLSDRNESFDLALVKALIFNKTNLSSPTSINEHYQFIGEKLHQIKKLYSDSNYSITKKKLEALGNKRARQMFPGMMK